MRDGKGTILRRLKWRYIYRDGRVPPFCSILYQRGIYPPENFASVAKYGLSVLVTKDEGLKTYLVQVLRQLAGGDPNLLSDEHTHTNSTLYCSAVEHQPTRTAL